MPLVAKREVNHDSTIYTFGLPDAAVPLGLPACACILMNAPGCAADGTDAVRPYTPISDDAMLGKFELLVKRYDGGAASSWLHGLPIGAPVEFKHIKFNLKAQYPFEGKSTFTLVAAGTGITPMYQALTKILGTPGDERKVTLIYGSKSASDILLKAEMDALATKHPHRLKMIHVIGEQPDAGKAALAGLGDGPFAAVPGWIDAGKLKAHAFPPSDETLLFVCGLPGMYDTLCGPRTEPELAEGTVLKELGYASSQVAKM